MTLIQAPMTSTDQKSHVSSHFNYLDIRNVMASLTMPSASCDKNVGDNGFT